MNYFGYIRFLRPATLALLAFTSPAHAQAPKLRIDIPGMTYAPKQAAVLSGTEITWFNSSRGTHTVTFDQSLARLAGSAQVPTGVVPFDSGPIRSSESFAKTFTVAGEYKYFCRPHETMGHLGTLTVIAENPTVIIPTPPEVPGTDQPIARLNSFVGQEITWKNTSGSGATIAILSQSRVDDEGNPIVIVSSATIEMDGTFQFAFELGESATARLTIADGRTLQHEILVWNR